MGKCKASVSSPVDTNVVSFASMTVIVEGSSGVKARLIQVFQERTLVNGTLDLKGPLVRRG